ncbi:MAG TPA: MBL fold metallo-hydrolase [Myxococcales bacterium]|jgi:glyoxylase-like metal-dependent hydrolase (beta-lactamase superfamily II)|nr:MBL fold metallo-hydrolase [Myxococcales bacterium]
MQPDRRAGAAALLGALALWAGCGLRVLSPTGALPLAPDAWAYVGGVANSMAILGRPDALAVDVKVGEPAVRMRWKVEEELGRKVRRILLTHSHLDHWEGLHLYRDAGVVLAHPRTRERITASLRQDRQPDTIPWVDVDGEVRLLVGDQEVWIRFLGVGHSDGDLVAFVPGRKLVATGDLFSSGFEPAIDPDIGGRLLGLRRALDRLLGYEFERVVPGHGEVAARKDVEAARDYLAAMEASLAGSIGRGRTEDQAVEEAEAALRGFPGLEVLPLHVGRRDNIRTMYRELRQPGKSVAP